MKLERDKLMIIVAAVLMLAFGAMYFAGGNFGGGAVLARREQDALAAPDAAADDEPIFVAVHVAGEVISPGVYELESGSRVQDALDAAGGPTGDADLNRINLAARLTDAQQIVVPKLRADGEPYAYPDEPESKLVNINTADVRALTALPGVGEVTAGNIVSYRERNGPFKETSDIKNVPRIGERTFEQLQDLITVN